MRHFILALAALVAWQALTLPGAAAPPPGRSERVVGPGVTLIREFRPDVPTYFHVLKVDLRHPHVRIGSEKLDLFKGEKVATTVARLNGAGEKVIAAVNGDFWTNQPRSFLPIGYFVARGMIYSNPATQGRSILATLASGEVVFTVVTQEVVLTLDNIDQPVRIPNLNSVRTSDSLTLFTPVFDSAIPVNPTRKLLRFALLSGRFLPNEPATLQYMGPITDAEPNGPTSGSLILALPADDPQAALLADLQPGTVGLLLARVPEVDGVITNAIGGGPRIVRDGQVKVEWREERMGESFGIKHPRTAAGISKDGSTLILAVADGRQPALSSGMTLDELAQLMLEEGAHDAINLDGGGSSTMVVRGEVVNSPSDAGGPRTVANAFAVFSTAPDGLPAARLLLDAPASVLRLPVGASTTARIEVVDEFYSPVPADGIEMRADSSSESVAAEVEGGVLRIRAVGPETATVMVSCDGLAPAQLRIQPVAVDRIEVAPEALVLSTDEEETLEVRLLDAEGQPITLLPGIVTISGGEGVAIDEYRITGRSTGSSHLTVTAGETSATVPVHVNRSRTVTLHSFDTPPTTTLRGVLFDESTSRAERETSVLPREGDASTAMVYTLLPGGTSKAALPIGAAIAERPAKLGVWVYGDASENWLRCELLDANSHRFLLDFTDGSKGITWKDEWKRIEVPLSSVIPYHDNPTARLEFPATVSEIYIAQTQEARKGSGRLLFDGLDAIYPPAD